jgi:2-oxoglutarate dehydrogenase E1 component
VLQGIYSGDNADFLDEQYVRWTRDPASVDPAWRAWFDALGEPPSGRYAPDLPPPPSIFGGAPATQSAAPANVADVTRACRAAQLVSAWRQIGHLAAHTDPLGLAQPKSPAELDPASWGLGPADLEASVPSLGVPGLPAIVPLRDLVAQLKRIYAGPIGIETVGIVDREQREFARGWLEGWHLRPSDPTVLRRALARMWDAELWERTCHARFPAMKRFSVEGAETMIALLDRVLCVAAEAGVERAIMGMPHRGRLATLVQICGKPASWVLDEFADKKPATGPSGDVKYHLGWDGTFEATSGRIGISLTPNPSHLETVDPLVVGRARAAQDLRGERRAILPISLHGDAAFCGQGVVAETLQLSEVDGYRVGGSIRIVVNNQVGFTTTPQEGRSTEYATDFARLLGIPVLHVNAEDLPAVVAVAEFAVAWRQRYGRDVIIDLVCYRRHGHNEGDEPSFTQPLMYEAIRARRSPPNQVAQQFVAGGLLPQVDVAAIEAERRAIMDAAANADIPHGPDAPEAAATAVDTRISMARLRDILVGLATPPEGFTPHPKLARMLANRVEAGEGKRAIDWATAELAAFGAALADGYAVRMSGQDVGRGTFSQRHATLSDARTGADGFPLERAGAPLFEIVDSTLSEYAVMGFEYGYAMERADALVLWEGQFGDFANGAQIVIDQYLAAAEQKWRRFVGLCLLLPHGYEGQGPEHSSARLERFLQLSAQDNLRVVCCSTPASWFHALRRQTLDPVRRPLVALTPKSLLRSEKATSTLDELASGSFHTVIADPAPRAETRRHVFCMGKVYYDLVAARGDAPVQIHRLEQLYPFPHAEISAVIASAPDADVVWAQEEPKNMGAWPMLLHWWLENLPGSKLPRYAGRPAAASPAVGSPSRHKREQEALVSDALAL